MQFGKFGSVSASQQLDQQCALLVRQIDSQKDKVKQLKGVKEADKHVVDDAVATLKRLKDEHQSLIKLRTDADPNRLHIVREDFDSLLLRKFFVVQAFEIYNGVAGLYDYGPPGCAVKANLLSLWRQHFVITENMLEIDSTCIAPEIVLKASGHVDRFNDFLVRDVKTGEGFRADKLLEEVIETKLEKEAANNISETQRQELLHIKMQAGNMSADKLHFHLQTLGARSPTTGNEVSEPIPFNLMFSTQIGPTGGLKGYMRPETAQSIFVNFKRLLDFNGHRMPFAAATIGQAFRNEIAPRSGLLRVREFTLAEIEHFVHPEKKDHPKFPDVEHLELSLFSRELQETGMPAKIRLGDAIAKGIVRNKTVGYFLGRVYLFLTQSGISSEGLRFRQHLSNEMAHYAQDCWDAEILTSYGWIECVGIADRACFDLTQHAKTAKCDMLAFESFDTPRTVTVVEKSVDKKAIGMLFKKDASKVVRVLDSLDENKTKALQQTLAQSGSAKLVDADTSFEFTITPDLVRFNTVQKTLTGESYVPHVVEPSFGIGRILYAILEHSYWVRQDNTEQRKVLSLVPAIAPYKVALMPLTGSSQFDSYVRVLSRELSNLGISFKVDENQTIGRRYARTDELGVPFAITIDPQSIQDDTVTLRERDSCTQIRAKMSEIVDVVRKLCSLDRQLSWENVRKQFPEQKETASEKVGKAADSSQ